MALNNLLENQESKPQIIRDFIFLQKFAQELLKGLEYFLYSEWFQDVWGYKTKFSSERDLVQTILDSIPILKQLQQNGFQISNDVKEDKISAFIKYVLYLQNDEVLTLTNNLIFYEF